MGVLCVLTLQDAAEKKAIVDADFEFSEKLHQQEWQQREAELAQRAEQVREGETESCCHDLFSKGKQLCVQV